LKKEEIRRIFLEKRRNLNPKEWEAACQKIHNLLFSRLPLHRYSPIHVFLPITKNHEPNTFLIIDSLLKDFSADIFISKSDDDGQLRHFLFDPKAELLLNKWGIPEPQNTENGFDNPTFFKLHENEEILIFLPLIIFDKQGHRVGYGKGYYDRFLSHATTKTTLVGLSLFEPIDKIEDISVNDIPMHFCISPERIWQW
jgi:5-formyltetrahydrofolate cyclo-ligase